MLAESTTGFCVGRGTGLDGCRTNNLAVVFTGVSETAWNRWPDGCGESSKSPIAVGDGDSGDSADNISSNSRWVSFNRSPLAILALDLRKSWKMRRKWCACTRNGSSLDTEILRLFEDPQFHCWLTDMFIEQLQQCAVIHNIKSFLQHLLSNRTRFRPMEWPNTRTAKHRRARWQADAPLTLTFEELNKKKRKSISQRPQHKHRRGQAEDIHKHAHTSVRT